MIPDQQSPVTLSAITLRGIGSYLRGARLDIRPLTVLCGKNGSGKSTWINALNLLRSSLRADRLPYAFDTSDLNPDDIHITNAFYFLASAEEHARFDSPEEELSYGPPGTIGLVIKVNRDFILPAVQLTDYPWIRIPDCTSSLDQFFWNGRCERGMEFRLRVAHPGHCQDSAQTPSLIDLIELQINHCDTMRLEGRRDPLQQFISGTRAPRRVFPYRFHCNGSYLPTKFRKPVSLIEVGELSTLA